MTIGKRYSVGQSPKIAAHAVEWRRVLSLAIESEAACVKMRVKKQRMRTYTT